MDAFRKLATMVGNPPRRPSRIASGNPGAAVEDTMTIERPITRRTFLGTGLVGLVLPRELARAAAPSTPSAEWLRARRTILSGTLGRITWVRLSATAPSGPRPCAASPPDLLVTAEPLIGAVRWLLDSPVLRSVVASADRFAAASGPSPDHIHAVLDYGGFAVVLDLDRGPARRTDGVEVFGTRGRLVCPYSVEYVREQPGLPRTGDSLAPARRELRLVRLAYRRGVRVPPAGAQEWTEV